MVVSYVNNSTTPLTDTSSFTGQSENISSYNTVNVSLYTDQNCNVYTEFSTDFINWDHSEMHFCEAGIAFWKQVSCRCKWFRIRVENYSGFDQTELRLQCSFHKELPNELGVKLDGSPSDGDSVQVLGWDGMGNVQMSVDSNGVVNVNPAVSTLYQYQNLDLGSGALVKDTDGHVHSMTASNMTANNRFVKLFDVSSAPTLGTDAPVATFVIPSYTTQHFDWSTPLTMTTGIGIACTEGVALLDTDTAETNDCVVHLSYA